jgi:hypothetical protein
MTSFCPLLANSKAMDLPRPREDPVTKMTFASSATIFKDDDDKDDDRLVLRRVEAKLCRPTKAKASVVAVRKADAQRRRVLVENFMALMINVKSENF